jgi:amidohydrolase
MTNIRKSAALESEMKEWRHHLHAHPETSFQEHNTSAFVAEKLRSFGLAAASGIGGTGVVGTLTRGQEGKAIGLRADMDALDIQEENDLDYKSTVPGKMHACGHDGHTAMLLGAAKYLALNGKFNGTVQFIFQPAEENEGGGRAMIEDNLFSRFPVDSVFGMHSFPILPEGSFAIRSGPMMAAYDVFDISVRGTGGHAAMPNIGRDPIVAVAQIISMFQTIVSRNVDPVESAVISVTEIKGGTAYNIIPETVTLRGTTRHFQPHIQDMIELRIKEVLKGVDTSMGVTTNLKYDRRYPAVVNAAKQTDEAISAAALVAGKDNIITNIPLIMGSEDFAFMLQAKPGAYIAVGAGMPRANGMFHRPGFDFNDRVLTTGTDYWISLVESLLVK